MTVKGDSVKSLEIVLNLGKSTIYNKINGKKPFSVAEILLLKSRWNLSLQEFNDIFLS